MRLRLLVLVLVALLPVAALAVQPDEMLKDPALEARARVLSEELRCLVCQNQSIDDSDAPLAHDIRVLLRERLEAGDSDAQAIDYLVARYGEFVLLRPRFNAHTLVLWLTAPAVLVIGGIAAFVLYRRRKAAPQPGELSPSEKADLGRILETRE
jgi:cytochrome c-type biogenesis protein CcmH